MKKKKILLISTLGLSALTVFGVLIGTTSTKGFTKLLGAGEKVTWNHYSAVAPSFANKGIKEYWVSCSSHGHQFTAPTGDDVDVVDKGAPSQEFINSLDTTDDRLLARIDDMAIDFEDDVYKYFISSSLTTTVTTEQAFNGTHSLKIVNSGSDNTNAFLISEEYYNRLPDEGIAFRLYADAAFNGQMPTGATQTYNGGHGIDNSNIKYWTPVNTWKDYVIPKSSIRTGDQHYIFKLGAGQTVYVDDIRPAYADSANVGFEDDRSLQKVIVDARNTNTITNENSFAGEYSLKIVCGEINSIGFKISDAIYDALPDEGLTFALNTNTAFNGWNKGGDGNQVKAWDVNKWVQHTVKKSYINPDAGNHYVFTFGGVATIYVDDVRPANFLDDKISTSFEEDYAQLLVGTESRNTAEVVSGTSFDGIRSLKVTVTAAHNKTFTLSDEFYNSLPEEGIKFYVYADIALNGGVWHYFAPVGEWKEITVAKSAINAAAGDHYVGTFYAAGTFYIDNVLPVTAS